MKIVYVALTALAGLGLGAMVGFGLALAVAKPRNDGTYGMRELIVGVPAGAVVGLVIAILIVRTVLR